MATVAVRPVKAGDVVKWELASDHGYSREGVTFTKVADSAIGDIVILDAGKYRALVAGDVAGIATAELGVLIDAVVYDAPVGDVADVAILARTSIVGDLHLNYFATATAQNILDVNARLKALGIQVAKQY